jgi:hypothetical protein
MSDYGLIRIWNYNFHIFYTSGVKQFASMNAFMQAYLMVDATFNILESFLSEEDDHKREARRLNVTHHLIGAICMYAFIIFQEVQFNSLYFSMTEVSTIPLHLGWAIRELRLNEKRYFKHLYIFFGVLAWTLFLCVRIIGSIFLWIYIITNIQSIMHMHLVVGIMGGIGGNLALTILNVTWFIKLTNMLLDGLKSKKKDI